MLPKEIKRYLEKHPEDIQGLIDEWGKGKVLSVEANSEGWSNVNVLVKTMKGNFYLRLVNELRRSRGELETEAQVLRKLYGLKLPVVRTLATVSEEYVVEFGAWGENFWASLFDVASGSAVEVLDALQVRSMGEEMATVDGALSANFNELQLREFDFTMELSNLQQQLRSQTTLIWPYHEVIEQKEFERFWMERLQLIGENYDGSRGLFSKTSLIHGDFHQANLRFDNQGVAAVLDFDNLTCAPRVLDVSICFYHLKYQQQRMGKTYLDVGRILIEGYEWVAKLTVEEKSVLPWLTEFWLWTLTPQLHYYSGELFGHREYQAERLATTLAGIRELQELEFD